MANELDSGALSAFFEGVAMMIAAGIQTDEAVYLLSENMEEGPFRDACGTVYRGLIDGEPLARAMEASGAFPRYALDMVRAGETSGRLENVLNSLATYYSEEERLFTKIRSAITYPTALMGVMTVILLFTVVVILPVFFDVYGSLSGDLGAGTFSYVTLAIGVGYVSLAVMAFGTAFAVVCMALSRGRHRDKLVHLLEHLSFTRDAFYHMALSRFTSALATFIAAGINTDAAMAEAISMIDHAGLRKKALRAYAEMTSPENPKSLAQAIYDNELFDPIYARMLVVGNRSGSTERVLQDLSTMFFDDAVTQIDGVIDSIEPLLAAFLTLSVGMTLIAVMLPLIGIMGSIG